MFKLYMQVPMVAMEMGVIHHSSNGRVILVRTDPSHRYLATLVSVLISEVV